MTDPLFHDFLVEHAKFPFPDCPIGTSASSTRLSEVDVGLLDNQWKAHHAVRDNDLANKLCDTLRTTLGEMTVTEDSRNFLLRWFLPTLSVDERGMEEVEWLRNSSEAKVSVILLPREFKLILWGRARCYYSSAFSRRCQNVYGNVIDPNFKHSLNRRLKWQSRLSTSMYWLMANSWPSLRRNHQT